VRITRSYLLGLGTGFMISALLALSLSSLGIKDLSQIMNLISFSKLSSSSTSNSSKQNQSTTQQSDVLKDNPLVPSSPIDPNIKTPVVPNNPTVSSNAAASNPITTPSIPATPNTPNPKDPILTEATQPLEKQLVIPNGVGSERIAELLLSQGLITNKAQFLETVEKRGVASKFQVGTFNLPLGLTPDEVLNRLLGKR